MPTFSFITYINTEESVLRHTNFCCGIEMKNAEFATEILVYSKNPSWHRTHNFRANRSNAQTGFL